MAETCSFCQQKIRALNSPKTCPKCGTAYCTRMDCGIGLMLHKCPICHAKPQLTTIKLSVNQPSQSVRFVFDNLGERTGVLLEMSMVEQLTGYITSVYHKNNPKQERILTLLTPVQSIVDSHDRESAVILSPKRWEKIVEWLAEIEAQTSPGK